jgi:uncharacterized membrane protein
MNDKSNRPKLQVERTNVGWLGEIVALLAIGFLLLTVVLNWTQLSNTVPVHFGIDGKPDRYGSKIELLSLPAIAVIMAVGLTFLAQFPHLFNYPARVTQENAPRLYSIGVTLLIWIKAMTLVLTAYAFWMLTQVNDGRQATHFMWGISVIVAILMGLLLNGIFQMRHTA